MTHHSSPKYPGTEGTAAPIRGDGQKQSTASAQQTESSGDQRNSTIDAAEVAKFSALASQWWDPEGKFKPLHKFNPHRLTWIRREISRHFGLDDRSKTPFKGLNILDIGCGGGLVCEPLCRLGARVTGLDASEDNVKTALIHARAHGLDIAYRAGGVETFDPSPDPLFDVVLNLEVVEHVADVRLFLETSASLVRPGGMMVVATINRTAKALLTAKIGAEYILRWLPRGTHDPRKFVKPQEVAGAMRASGLTPLPAAGMTYIPLKDSWRVSADVSVNYMMIGTR